MSFLIAGDTHGTLDLDKVVRYYDEHDGEFTKDDYLVILGDVGVCGFSPAVEAETREIFRNLPVTTLFVDGNHEHFVHLNSYPVDEWNGGKVHFIEKDIIHLMRGQVFTIDGTKFFTFGGAVSIDRMYRTIGESWFEEEVPTTDEMREGWENLEKNGFSVDYILTHTGPREVVAALGYDDLTGDETPIRQYFQRVADNTDFKAWFFGHFHVDEEVEEQFFCLYDEVKEL